MVEVPIPQIAEENVDVVRLVPQERVQRDEQIAEVFFPQFRKTVNRSWTSRIKFSKLEKLALLMEDSTVPLDKAKITEVLQLLIKLTRVFSSVFRR